MAPYASVIITVIVASLLLFFRSEVKTLVSWVVGFKRLAKTKDGYELESSPEPISVVESTQIRSLAAVATVQLSTDADDLTMANEFKRGLWVGPLSEHRYDEAIKFLQDEQDRTVDADERLELRSISAHVKFRVDPAAGVKAFEELIREFPTNDIAYIWFGLSYTWSELPETALNILNRGLAAAKKKGRLFNECADALIQMGKLDEALHTAIEGTRVDPGNVGNFTTAALLLTKLGKFDDARSWYRRAIQCANGSDDIVRNYAEWLFTHDYIKEAALYYTNLLSGHPKDSTLRTLLGNCYLSLDLYSMALEAYMRANEDANEDAGWILANIGNVLKNRGFHAYALTFLKRAAEKDPDSQYAHDRLASALKADEVEKKKLDKIIDDARQSEAAIGALSFRVVSTSVSVEQPE